LIAVSSKKREEVFVHAKQAEIFANHLRFLRKEKGFTQMELAYEANVDVSTIARIEAGRQNVTLDTIFGLAKALKVHPKELFDFPED
jgi:transcriptional regulator with XRE-family HTH domain